MGLRLTNTYTRTLEEVEPLHPGEVRLYTCGPTVHDFAHIGNFRTYVFEDVLRRYLEYRGLRVRQVMNITDIEDKIIKKAREAGVGIREYTERYTAAFFEDCKLLRLEPAEEYPRATDFVPEMIDLIRVLESKGATYVSDGSVYFRISTFPGYGRLSGIDPEAVRPGARVDVDEYEKDDARDFVLWKAAREGEPSWDSPWGKGRPGWHIECSAMSMKLLGEELDIHTGGADNVFPHHENEIAQSVTATGRGFARIWAHSEWLLVDGEKMSKSKGNFFTVRDLVARGISPLALRLLLLRHHYRAPLNFTFDTAAGDDAALQRLQSCVRRLREDAGRGGDDMDGEVATARAGFEGAMDQDLNTASALGAVFTLVTRVNAALDAGTISPRGREAVLGLLMSFDRVLAVLEPDPVDLPEDLRALLHDRLAARARRDFAESDRLRAELAARGVLLEDTRGGCRATYQGRPVRGL